LLTEFLDEMNHFGKGYIAIIITLNQQDRRTPSANRG
jgi:hypothetical protein